MADPQPQMNEPAARTETGEIKPQSSTATDPSTTSTTTPTETSTDPKTESSTKPTEGAPEAYTDFKLPEGVELKGEVLTKATELFKGLGLTQDAAQSLVDFHTAQMKSAAEAPLAEYETMRSDWKSKAAADPAIGPLDGAKAKGIAVNIGRALDAIGDKSLKDDFQSAMNITGVGDHPAFIKIMDKFAAKFNEGKALDMGSAKPAATGQTAPDAAPKSIASALYPNLPA